MTSPILGSGLLCAAMLAFGFDMIVPVSHGVGQLCNLAAIASGMVFLGLIDGE